MFLCRGDAILAWEGFTEYKIKSDGNYQLKTCPKLYKEFVEMDSSKKKRTNDLPKDNSDYVKNMSKNGVWGDSVTLQAAADTFGVKNSGHYIGKRIHYNSIYLKGSETDAAPMELPGKGSNKNTNNSDKDMNTCEE
ncbi:OTU domain-containing protein [Raphanus sativus]|nr:OTU domain-containing protein [Raphanus sativus]